MLCVSAELERHVVKCTHEVTPCPDHKAVMMCLKLGDKKRGKGYWKLNISVLNEEGYKDKVRNIIRHTREEYQGEIDKEIIWELIKIRVKEFSIRYCCIRSSIQVSDIKKLEEKISMLDKEISKSGQEDLVAERKTLKEELDVLYQEKAIGAQIRAKIKYIEEGEQSTSYFLATEKYRQSNNVISALTKNNITYFEDLEVLSIARDCYTDLYTSKKPSPESINDFVDSVNLPLLSENRRDVCDGEVSFQECERAINNIKSNKSPGEDGLPIEFYKAFWNEIGQFLVDVYNECFQKGELPLSMRKSVITLIFKKGDRTDILNYRPISLTNTDYRILASVLSARLQTVETDIISPDQVAYIKGRYIGTNVRLIHDIFNLYNEQNISGLLMFVDFRKEFDSIEWDFLFRVLQKFNFGSDFQQWIKLLYTRSRALVKNNGFFLRRVFFIERGQARLLCLISIIHIMYGNCV